MSKNIVIEKDVKVSVPIYGTRIANNEYLILKGDTFKQLKCHKKDGLGVISCLTIQFPNGEFVEVSHGDVKRAIDEIFGD